MQLNIVEILYSHDTNQYNFKTFFQYDNTVNLEPKTNQSATVLDAQRDLVTLNIVLGTTLWFQCTKHFPTILRYVYIMHNVKQHIMKEEK